MLELMLAHCAWGTISQTGCTLLPRPSPIPSAPHCSCPTPPLGICAHRTPFPSQITPLTVSFKCTLEAIGAYASPYASATFHGTSFMRPGDDSVSSIGIANFFKKVGYTRFDCWATRFDSLCCAPVLRCLLTTRMAHSDSGCRCCVG